MGREGSSRSLGTLVSRLIDAPLCPNAPSPQTLGAPNATALNLSVPRRNPPSTMTGASGNALNQLHPGQCAGQSGDGKREPRRAFQTQLDVFDVGIFQRHSDDLGGIPRGVGLEAPGNTGERPRRRCGDSIRSQSRLRLELSRLRRYRAPARPQPPARRLRPGEWCGRRE